MRRFHEAKLDAAPHVTLWGTGTPRREFLHVDDLAEALFVLMTTYEEPQTINVGTGQDLPIGALGELMAHVTGFTGALTFDTTRPDGAPRKLLDISRIQKLGWRPRISLEQGLAETYEWAQQNGRLDALPD